jgi:hypothetical protein
MSDFTDLGAVDFSVPAMDVSAVANAYDPAVDDYGTNIVTPVESSPTFLQSLGGVWTNAAQGIATGAGQVATGVNQLLPNVLVNSLAQSVGLTARTVPAANGQTVTYIQPAKSGVPAAGPTGVTVGGTSVTTPASKKLSTGTILLIAGIILAAFLLLRSK